MIRLDRLLVDRGLGSRTEVQKLIKFGRIELDGKVMRSPKVKVPLDSVPIYDGEPLAPSPLLYAFHKPADVLCASRDRWGRMTLTEVVPHSIQRQHHPVGRLDFETTGLLLYSREGSLTQRLLHPKRKVERVYRAKVASPIQPELVDRLAAGVETAEGVHTAHVVQFEGDTLELIVTEGRHRMVRRMLNNAGYPVLSLTRIRFGTIELGDLEEGRTRPVTDEELTALLGS